MTRGRSLAALSLLAALLVCGMAGAADPGGPGGAGVRVHGGRARGRASRRDHVRRARAEQVPARDDGQRCRPLRLRRRRLAGRLPGERHDARGLPEGRGAHEPPLPQPRRRHLRGPDAASDPRAHRLGAGSLRRRLRQRRPRRPLRDLLRAEPPLPEPGPGRVRGRDRPCRARELEDPLGNRMRLSRLRPGRPPGPLRRELHRPRSQDGARARVGALPLQGSDGRVRAARPARGQERPLPQPGGRALRGRVAARRHPQRGDLRPRRDDTRLRRRRLDRPLRGQRLEPERALPEPPRRNLRGRGRPRRVRLQPGRQAPGRHGPRDRGLRPQRDARHLQDQLRGRHLDALLERRRRILRRPDLRERRRRPHPLAGLGRRASWTSTTTDGWISSSPTATSTPRSSSSRARPATSSARWSTSTWATAASRTSPSGSGPR